VAFSGYLIPLMNRETNYFGKIVRIDLRDFTTQTIRILDLARVDQKMRGFSGAFSGDVVIFSLN